jgi:hypothetical protein
VPQLDPHALGFRLVGLSVNVAALAPAGADTVSVNTGMASSCGEMPP